MSEHALVFACKIVFPFVSWHGKTLQACFATKKSCQYTSLLASIRTQACTPQHLAHLDEISQVYLIMQASEAFACHSCMHACSHASSMPLKKSSTPHSFSGLDVPDLQ